MIRRSLTLGFVLLIVAAFHVTGISMAQDDIPIRGHFPILRDGDFEKNAFADGVTAHLYGFNATGGDVITITMTPTPGTELDPYLVLLGPWGEVITDDDDSGGDLAAAIIDFTLPASGSYFIMASTFVDLNNVLVETGDEEVSPEPKDYTITLDGNTQPTNLANYTEDSLTYFRGDLEFGNKVRGDSTAEEPVFYLGFVAETGQVVDIILTSDEFDTALHLFGMGGLRLAVNDDDPEMGTTDSAIRNFEIPEAGFYLIFATDVFFYNANKELDSLNFKGGEFIIELRRAD